MVFHPRAVDPSRIDYARSGPDDPRVRHARQGYESQTPERVPPIVLVHRNGVFMPADGHHRAEGAHLARKPVRAYVAYSPHDSEPFSDGERGPFHGAETEDREPYPDQHGERRRISYPGFPHAADAGIPDHEAHTAAALTGHFAAGTQPAVRPPLLDRTSADHVLPAPARYYDGAFTGVANWSPETPEEAAEFVAGIPEIFQAFHDGMMTVAGRLDEAPVDPAMAEALRAMALRCLNAAEDARIVALPAG